MDTRKVDKIQAALADELREPYEMLYDRAETLVAIAQHYHVGEDEVLVWIRYRAPWKAWSAFEFRQWCARLAELKEQLAASQVLVQICPNCFAHPATQVSPGRWWCQDCGEVHPV